MPDGVKKRTPWNKGKLIGAETALATQARLVDQNAIDGRGANSRPRPV